MAFPFGSASNGPPTKKKQKKTAARLRFTSSAAGRRFSMADNEKVMARQFRSPQATRRKSRRGLPGPPVPKAKRSSLPGASLPANSFCDSIPIQTPAPDPNRNPGYQLRVDHAPVSLNIRFGHLLTVMMVYRNSVHFPGVK